MVFTLLWASAFSYSAVRSFREMVLPVCIRELILDLRPANER